MDRHRDWNDREMMDRRNDWDDRETLSISRKNALGLLTDPKDDDLLDEVFGEKKPSLSERIQQNRL